jgi:hypothetical protein
MNKGALVGSLFFLIAAFYLFILAARPGETVQIIPGQDIPDRFAVLLGVIALVGTVGVGAEALRGKKETENEAPPRDVRRAS